MLRSIRCRNQSFFQRHLPGWATTSTQRPSCIELPSARRGRSCNWSHDIFPAVSCVTVSLLHKGDPKQTRKENAGPAEESGEPDSSVGTVLFCLILPFRRDRAIQDQKRGSMGLVAQPKRGLTQHVSVV